LEKGVIMYKYLILVLFSALILIGCSENIQAPDASDTSLNKNSRNYTAHLSGDNENPPVMTQAQGQVIFRLNKAGDELYYKLIAANIEDISMAHIHLAPPDSNGGVVAWLYPSAPPPVPIPGRFSGVLAEGVITDADLVGDLAGMTLADLLVQFNNSRAYVNVHTAAYPGGEIRGNIMR
jgi:hypothetical protein